jgi:hypothetical protein
MVSASKVLLMMLACLICYSAIFILLLIARSKLVLDFALTVHFIHLIVTSLYTHAIPDHLFWWALQMCSATIMTSLGVWACQWRELRPINFGSKTPARQQPAAEEEGGESRGRGRGRGRDGAEEYEMVSMGEGDSNV